MKHDQEDRMSVAGVLREDRELAIDHLRDESKKAGELRSIKNEKSQGAVDRPKPDTAATQGAPDSGQKGGQFINPGKGGKGKKISIISIFAFAVVLGILLFIIFYKR